jgi:serine/threonine protein kinase
MGGDVASALHHAHTLKSAHGQPLNMIHRDVSPHNILVTTQGQAKLVDFGIARAESNQVKTRTGMVKGKSGYMSPEQALGRTLDGRSDQFALAIVLYETAAQARIFQGENDLAIMRKVVACEIPPLISVDPNASLAFSEVLEQALQRAAEDRFADCDAFAKALYDCLDSAGYRGGHQPVATWVQRMSAVEGKLAKLPSLDERKELSGVREEITKISRSRSAMRPATTPQRGHAAAGKLSRPAQPPSHSRTEPTSWLPLTLAGGLLALGLIAFLLTSQRSLTESVSAPVTTQRETTPTQVTEPQEKPVPVTPEPVVDPAPKPTPKPTVKPQTKIQKPSTRTQKKRPAKRALNNQSTARARVKFQFSRRAILNWGNVFVDGKRLNGDNPEIKVSVGRHKVCVSHPNNGDPRVFKKTINVPAEGILIPVNMDLMAVPGSCP